MELCGAERFGLGCGVILLIVVQHNPSYTCMLGCTFAFSNLPLDLGHHTQDLLVNIHAYTISSRYGQNITIIPYQQIKEDRVCTYALTLCVQIPVGYRSYLMGRGVQRCANKVGRTFLVFGALDVDQSFRGTKVCITKFANTCNRNWNSKTRKPMTSGILGIGME